jgi:AcrR family transcriptional regulator
MVRKYNSSRRKEGAEETRRRILQAALELHGEGITEFEPLARKAGCSVPTVRKHFPTKESLYRDCTRTFAETLEMPDLDALGQIANPVQRLEECVIELCRIHEAMFGYAWFSAHAREGSETLDAEMKGYEGLADAMAEIIQPGVGGVVRGLLDFLTYRALRLSGNLAPEDARTELTSVLRPLVLSAESTPHTTRGDRS